jgi:oligopeptide/dipeptide ABC transporter ATP-binding protein
VAEFCDNIQVMYAGRVVEYGRTDDLFYQPHHPYTWGLLSSIPKLGQEDERLTPIRGLPPSLINLPAGCSFAPRCNYAFDRCTVEAPALIPADTHHASACHLSLKDKERIAQEEVLAGR